jgi:hypothetical protein
MMNFVKLFVLFCVPFLFTACAAKNQQHLPSFAITEPSEAISTPHPIEMQKNGVSNVTTWRGVMSPDLLVEVIAGNGVFPVIGSDGEKEFRGFAYLVDLNYWGDWIIQYEFPYSAEELKDVHFVLTNRDGGFAYTIDGPMVAKEDVASGKLVNPYNAETFDKDLAVRNDFIAEFGKTLGDIDIFWQEYLLARGVDIGKRSMVKTYVVGSDDWLKLVEGFNREIDAGELQTYKVGEQIRVGKMNFDEFADKASDVPDFSVGDRFIKRTSLPIISLASVALGPLAIAGANIAGSVYSSNIDNDWHGHTLRSKFWGHELAPTFRSVCGQYKKLLTDRDKQIRELKQKNQLSLR